MRAIVAVALTLLALVAPSKTSAADAEFQKWLDQTWPDAQRLGVSRTTFDAATRGLEPDLSLPDLIIPGRREAPQKGQAEFVQIPADYLRESSLARLAAQGRKLAAEHRATLAAIEQRFGVPGPVILAIWGRETDYGNYRLSHNAVRVLATQGYLGRRKDHFREEFLLALKMLQEGHIALSEMRASWAGAMGLTQFLPSDFYKYSVDFDGDGSRDIWRSVPDALASAAKQLVDKGWQRGKSWGYEMRAPATFDCTLAEPDTKLPVGEWLQRGFRPAFGRRFSAAELADEGSLLLPAGPYGPAFLTLQNFYVLKGYNFSDLYALFVGHLADRIAGASRFETAWGKVTQMPSDRLEAMQRRLAADGFYSDKIDGKAGMKTRAALGAYQKANRLTVDCWPNAAVLDHMRRRSGQ